MWIHDVQWRDSVPYGETLHDKYYLFYCICIITKQSKVALHVHHLVIHSSVCLLPI